jgi:hypothetical protein
MKLRGEVDAKTFREVTAEIDAVHDQLAREHDRLASEAAMPELPDPSAWEDLSAEDRRALTELLVNKITTLILFRFPVTARVTALVATSADGVIAPSGMLAVISATRAMVLVRTWSAMLSSAVGETPQ